MKTPQQSNTSTPDYIVATDLDGTLLDHHNYQWQAALPAIEFLGRQQVPIVFNTSKTLSEALDLQQQIGLSGPLIVENGSALALNNDDYTKLQAFISQGMEVRELNSYRLIIFGRARSQILNFIREQRTERGDILEGFNDWTLEEIAEHTGLDTKSAQYSSQKMFSEPFVWKSDDESYKRFEQAARQHHFQILRGGRFYHLQGKTDKAKPIKWLQAGLSKLGKKAAPTLICLGDNQNDIHMLNAADIPVCVKSPIAPYPQINPNPEAIHTESLGPAGWTEAIARIFPEFHAQIHA